MNNKNVLFKIISTIICFSFICSLLYCPYDVHAETDIKQRDWTKYKSTYYYDQLDEYGKKFYDGMEEACIQFISSKDNANIFVKELYVIW